LVGSAQAFAGDGAGCGAGILDTVAALERLDAIIDQRLPDDPGEIEDG
jgi:hypothetical protein